MSEQNTFVLQPKESSRSVTEQTADIQALLTRCRDEGGGIVEVAAGEYTWGSVRIYSNTTLHLNSGVVIRASDNLADYQSFGEKTSIDYVNDAHYVKIWHLPKDYFHAILAAYDAENVAITADAGAMIDGRDLVDPSGEEGFRGPMGFVFSRVKHLALNGYLVQNSANWSHVIESCDAVEISNVTINAGHDGFNLHHSQNVVIDNCVLHTGDDCLAGYDIHNLTVKDCWLNTACNGMRLGGKQITLNRCIFAGPERYPHRSEDTYDSHAFFKYYAMDADHNRYDGEEMAMSQVIVANCRRLLAYEWGDKENMQNGRPLRQLTLTNVQVSGLHQPSVFKGHGEPVHLQLDHCQITPPEDAIFLKIDDSVTFECRHVVFEKPAQIELGDGRRLTLSGSVDLLLNGQK
ncbi:glycosyl hydrolase family 28 protein [Lacticaseibacillus rhamnosus]|uniref:glycosyl hydrolase family 28 protein n=2 Tax=Lacticaseibacillus rhamnosus TaxID=47715 RepID=UPI0031FDD21D